MNEQFSEIVEKMIDAFSDTITDNPEFENALDNIEKQTTQSLQYRFIKVHVSELSEGFIEKYLGDIGGEAGTEVKQLFRDIVELFGEEYISLILENPDVEIEAVEKDAINNFMERHISIIEEKDDDDGGYTLKCPECKTAFTVEEDKVGGKPFNVECPNCGADILCRSPEVDSKDDE